MKRGPVYYSEEVLVEKHQSGDFTWLDYISHYSEEWCDEYEEYCAANNLDEDDEANAAAFVAYKDEQLENAIASGEA